MFLFVWIPAGGAMIKHSSEVSPLRLPLSLASKQRPSFTATHPFLHTEFSDWSTLKVQPTKPSPLIRNHVHPFVIHGRGLQDGN